MGRAASGASSTGYVSDICIWLIKLLALFAVSFSTRLGCICSPSLWVHPGTFACTCALCSQANICSQLQRTLCEVSTLVSSKCRHSAVDVDLLWSTPWCGSLKHVLTLIWGDLSTLACIYTHVLTCADMCPQTCGGSCIYGCLLHIGLRIALVTSAGCANAQAQACHHEAVCN